MVGTAAAVIAAIAFSTEGLFSVRSVEAGVDVSTALTARYLVATAVTLTWLYFLGRRPSAGGREATRRRHSSRDLLYLAAAGLLAHFGLPRLLFEAFLLIPTWLTLLVFYSFPAMVAIGEHLLGRERLSRQRLVIVATTLAGVGLVAQSQDEATVHLLGVMYALGAAILNTVFMLMMGPVLERTPLRIAVATQFGGGLAGHAAVLLAGGVSASRLAAVPAAWPWLVALGILTTVVPVVALNLGIRAIGAGKVAVIGTLEPVFVIVWGVTLLGETINAQQVLGAVMIVSGVAGVVVSGRSRPAPE